MTTEGRPKNQGGHHVATTDRRQIREWWSRSPASGIGVSAAASRLVFVDCDPRNAGDKTITQLRKSLPGVFDTPVQQMTGRGDGGMHLVFAAEQGARYPGKLGKGIDCKANGYVVVSPSLHPVSKKPYTWKPGCDPFEHDFLIPVLSAETANSIFGSRFESSSRSRSAADSIEDSDEEHDPFADMTDETRLGLTEEQIRKIVFSIPNAGHEADEQDYHREGARNYEDWLGVISGIYHETEGSPEGEAIAREWSEQSAKHEDQKFDKSWRSLDHKGKGIRPITFRFCRKLSNDATRDEREAKYEQIRARMMEADDLDEIQTLAAEASELALTNPLQREAIAADYRTAVKRATKTTVLTLAQARKAVAFRDPSIRSRPDWCETVCFVSQENMFFDYHTGTMWTTAAFDNTFLREAMTEEDIRSGQTRPSHNPSDLALTRYAVPIVMARGYVPWVKMDGKAPFYTRDGIRYVNTYHGRFAAKMPKGDLTDEQRAAMRLFVRFMEFLIPDDRERAILISWIRFIITKRGRVGWAPVLLSVEGTGKTILFDLIKAMIGHNNTSLVTGVSLNEKFNSWAENVLVSFVEEVNAFNRRDQFDAMNHIKPVITNATISVRRMRVDTYVVENTTNVIMTTNKRNAFDVDRDGGDSRLWFARVTPRFRNREDVERFKRENPDFYPSIIDAFTKHAGAIKRYIVKETVYHSEFQPGGRAPVSALKRELAQEMKGEERLLIEEIIRDEPRRDLTGTLLRVDRLMEECGERDPTVTMPADRWFSALLREMGFERVGRIRTGGRTSSRAVYWSREPQRFQDKAGNPLRAAIDEWMEDDEPL